MAMISKCDWLPWAVACVFGMTDAVCAQSPAFSITLTDNRWFGRIFVLTRRPLSRR
jgi:hypothetical protein